MDTVLHVKAAFLLVNNERKLCIHLYRSFHGKWRDCSIFFSDNDGRFLNYYRLHSESMTKNQYFVIPDNETRVSFSVFRDDTDTDVSCYHPIKQSTNKMIYTLDRDQITPDLPTIQDTKRCDICLI